MPVNSLIQLRKGDDLLWSSQNPILASGEPGYDISNRILKIGDGNTPWNTLAGLFVDQSTKIVTNVFNKTASTISKFSVVYIDGGQGDQPTIQLAIASGEMGSSKTYGITATNIASMDSGRVVVVGALTGVNTDQFNPTAPVGNINGTTLWLSPTVSGGVTTTKPYAPYHSVSVGTVVRTHPNEGVVEVKIQNGYELEELHNVAITGVTNGQFLQYNSISGLWLPSSSGNFTTLQINGSGVLVEHPTISAASSSNNSGRVYIQDVLLDNNGHVTGITTATETVVDTYVNSASFNTSNGVLTLTKSDSSTVTVDLDGRFVDGGGTASYVSKWSDTDTLTNSIIYDNGTNIGIGTTSPARNIDIVSSAGTSVGFKLNSTAAGGRSYSFFSTNNTSSLGSGRFGMYDDTAQASRMVVDSVGNIGIGTNNPSYKLDVVGTGHFDALNINGAFTFPTSDGSANQYLKTDGAGNVSWAAVGGVGSTIDGSGVSNYITKWTDSDTLTSGIIYDNGTNIGIGTSSPTYKLHVVGTGNFSQNLLVNGTGVSLSGHIHTISIGTGDVSQLSFNTNQVLNIIGSGGINISFNDTTNTLTISPPIAVTGYEELTSNKTTFNVSPNYRVGTLSVYYNGFRLINGRDFTATNGTSFALSETAIIGDVVEWVGTT